MLVAKFCLGMFPCVFLSGFGSNKSVITVISEPFFFLFFLITVFCYSITVAVENSRVKTSKHTFFAKKVYYSLNKKRRGAYAAFF